MTTNRTLLLVRHPEARKNVEDRHGGEGSGLTARGIEQCQSIADFVVANYSPLYDGQLVGHNVHHVRLTVAQLAPALQLAPTWDERLRGIYLGVLAGLSRAEAAVRYQGPAERLELWRQSRIQLDQLDIPEAEPAEAFRQRVASLLAEWCRDSSGTPIVAVCTRSVLIMLVNLLEMGERFSYADYKAREFASGGVTTVRVVDGDARLVAVNQSVT